MPRRRKPDPLAARVGARVRQLREEAGLTLEQLAFESELGSKGHLSDIERGLVRPTIATLQLLADRLGLALLDVVTFPDEDLRQKLVDHTRRLSLRALRELVPRLADFDAAPRAAERPGGATYPRGGKDEE